jgi:hypothetical protein
MKNNLPQRDLMSDDSGGYIATGKTDKQISFEKGYSKGFWRGCIAGLVAAILTLAFTLFLT